jgi:molecular chaperone IbpA
MLHMIQFVNLTHSLLVLTVFGDILMISTEQRKHQYQSTHYNILKQDEDHYSIEIAVAGFTEKDLDVTLEDAKLVTGKVEEKDEVNLLHRGIANRSFTRQFTLADTIEIEGAHLEHGMLTISLKNIIPDSKKPKKIEVTTGDKLLEVKSEPELLTEE